MAFGLGGLVALSAAGKIPKAMQDYDAAQAALDESQRKALAMAAIGSLGGAASSNLANLSDPNSVYPSLPPVPGQPPASQPPGGAPPMGGQAPPPGVPPPQQPPPQPWTPGRTVPVSSKLPPGPGMPPQMTQDPQGGNIPPPQAGQVGPMPNQLTMNRPAGMTPGEGMAGAPPGFARQLAPPGSSIASPPIPGMGVPPMQPGQQPPMSASLGGRYVPPGGGPPPGSPQQPTQVASGASPGGSVLPPGGQSQGGQPPATPQQQQELTGAMRELVSRGLVPQFGFQWQDLAKQLVQANPQLKNRPDVIGQAILLAAPLMNKDSLSQFRELQLVQREKELREKKDEFDKRMAHQTSEREAREAFTADQKEQDRRVREGIADVRNKLAGDRLLNADPQVRTMTNSLTGIQKNYDAINAYSRYAAGNGDRLLSLAQKVDETGSPVLDRWIRGGRRSILGDADVNNFDFQLRSFQIELARVMNTANITGQLTNQAKADLDSFLGLGATRSQLAGIVNTFKTDAQDRQQKLGEQVDEIRGKIDARKEALGGGPQPKSPPTVPPAAAPGTGSTLPPGFTITPVQ